MRLFDVYAHLFEAYVTIGIHPPYLYWEGAPAGTFVAYTSGVKKILIDFSSRNDGATAVTNAFIRLIDVATGLTISEHVRTVDTAPNTVWGSGPEYLDMPDHDYEVRFEAGYYDANDQAVVTDSWTTTLYHYIYIPISPDGSPDLTWLLGFGAVAVGGYLGYRWLKKRRR